ncbi:COG2426 family protein [Wukongibacter sp. M2B1]|uniref:COG2426 family protein n=1 Tax=Wukongibacter sp. M2B1 TaxID=3088895 RepID=UPI003D797C3E
MNLFLSAVLNFLTIELIVFLTAALPIIELRGAIPIGVSLGLTPLNAAIISIMGSMIPVPILLFGIRTVLNFLKKVKLFKSIVYKLINRSIDKSGKVQKYGAWGLILFVAIPLPGTGIWSGTLIAALLNMRFKWAFPAILVGNIIAAIVVMSLSSGVVRVFS